MIRHFDQPKGDKLLMGMTLYEIMNVHNLKKLFTQNLTGE